MNEKFTNNSENVADKLNQVVEQTHVNSQFVAELETKLRSARRPKMSWFAALFRQISPTVRWVALMILLGLVLSLSIKTLIPAPQPATNGTPTIQGAGETPTSTPTAGDVSATPSPQGESYDYGNQKLIVNAQFPDAPMQASVYTLLDTKPANAEYAQTLAKRFDIEGELYMTEGLSSDTTALMVTDGKQELVVYAENEYTYTSDKVKYSRSFIGTPSLPNENAEAIIREYMKNHGFDFDFRVKTNNAAGQYVVEQLASDGLPLPQSRIFVTFQENGEILHIDVSLMDYDVTPLGIYEVTTAEEALKQLISDAEVGVLSGGSNMPDPNLAPPQAWYHDYPDNQIVTVYETISSYQAVDSNVPAMIFIGNVPAVGNTSGMDAFKEDTFVQATGQFIVENGLRKFNVDTWNTIQRANFQGSAHQEGDQIIIEIEDENGSKSILVDPPTDLPLNTEHPEIVFFNGANVDEQFYWTDIAYYSDFSQRGGGGGGGGYFYLLNLSGTPVPFPTAAPTTQSAYSPEELASFAKYTVQPGDTLSSISITYNVSIKDIMLANDMTGPTAMITAGETLIIPTTRLEGEHGIVQVQMFENSKGRQRTVYQFLSEKGSYELKGTNLEPLQKVNNLPVKIWGDTSANKRGRPFLNLEKFEVLYPDLQFQVLTGTQTLKKINGEDIVLFTTGDTTYVQIVRTGGYPDSNYLEDAKEVNVEALQVPGETYAGYPALRVFNLGHAIDPTTGDPAELQRTTDKIEVMPDPWGDAEPYASPDIIIEKMELVYSFCDAIMSFDDASEPAQPQRYLQPVWDLQGHDTNGNEVSITVQALKQQYLLPYTEP